MEILQHILVFMAFSSSLSHQLAKPVGSTVGDVICPDGRHACPSGSTCCKQMSGSWGCCPIANAVCCADHLHCCPQSTVCDTAHGRCLKGIENSVPWQKKMKAKEFNSTIVNDVRCDSFSSCPDGTTCCKLTSGDWGCCPIPNAVCCKDHLHCCPSGTVCDTVHGKCTQREGLKIGEEISAKVHLSISENVETSYKTVICPDKESYCPDGSTCCKLPSGTYGCCPMPRATCCKDHLHCCPHGSICDTEHSTCRKGVMANAGGDECVPWSTKTKSEAISSLTRRDICQDKQTMCLNGHKCCITVDADWGCCAP